MSYWLETEPFKVLSPGEVVAESLFEAREIQTV